MKSVRPEPWMDGALCTQVDPELFFPEVGGSSRLARRICASCPVARECLEYAVLHGEMGIWGGTSAKARREIRARRQACA